MTVRAFRLTGVRVLQGGQLVPLPDARTRLVNVADQQPNPGSEDHPVAAVRARPESFPSTKRVVGDLALRMRLDEKPEA